jgi:hypothetical protein
MLKNSGAIATSGSHVTAVVFQECTGLRVSARTDECPISILYMRKTLQSYAKYCLPAAFDLTFKALSGRSLRSKHHGTSDERCAGTNTVLEADA